ncbi:MAG: hypothetical protein QUS08_01175 [Methanothrix sp.]|nr:hypothetical protein [Methanothrix sp.]
MIRALLLGVLVAGIASGVDYGFGTKVQPGDLDIGRPLYDSPDGTSVVYWDIGPEGYDVGDPVYLHISSTISNTIGSGDLRLSEIGNRSPGSKVLLGDVDMGMPSVSLPSSIRYMNLFGGQGYDLDDPVYLHQHGCDAGRWHEPHHSHGSPLEGFSERLSYRGGISVPGTSIVEFSDGYRMLVSDRLRDEEPRVSGRLNGMVVEVVEGLDANYYHVLGTWLVRIGRCEPSGFSWLKCGLGLLCTNDLRLSAVGNRSPGTKVVDLDEDGGRMLSSVAIAGFSGPARDASRVRYFDENGNGMYDPSDSVYLNYPSGTPEGIVVINNLRLTPVNVPSV